jgi:acetyl esterase
MFCVMEGGGYADALRAAGVAVDHREYRGMIHGLFGMIPAVDDAARAQQNVYTAFRRALSERS